MEAVRRLYGVFMEIKWKIKLPDNLYINPIRTGHFANLKDWGGGNPGQNAPLLAQLFQVRRR